MSKVAIYCRLSDEDKNKKSSIDDSESIQNQKNLLMKYALEKGWNIYKIYSDDDYSGLDAERPEFNSMLRDAREGKFNIILCKTQSRFTRDMELVEKYLHNKFLQWGIRFVTAVDGVDTLDKHNKKSRQINGLVNEWYCEDISESIKAVFRMKQNTGKFIGSFSSYGYIKDPKDKNKLIVDEEAAQVVRLIFNLYIEGNGTQHIASILNKRNIPNPTKYKQMKGFKYKNNYSENHYGFWNKTTVKRILKNQLYIGNMVQHKCKKISCKSKKIKILRPDEWITVEDTHVPIIDKKTFNMVQDRINSNVRSTRNGITHILAGKVKCLDCKSNMAKNSTSKKYSYLRCRLYLLDSRKKLCTSHSIRLEKLEQIVLQRMRTHINLLCDSDKLAEMLLKEQQLEVRLQYLNKQLRSMEKEIVSRIEALKNTYLDKIKGLISEDEFSEFNSVFLKEKENFVVKKENLQKIIDELKKKSLSVEQYKGIVEEYKKFSIITHSMVNELIDYIEIGEKNKETSEQEIIIYWNF
ncbi:recombinase family protein [Clostridium sp. DJ247]|uniref:recombinase family protein n=1 Tax=Clostridium sp. DJ247 TaxID=2726188 RepID=UPI0016266258|nr:recombinase family protein [Clostridium sp. DJ247]MBC2579727.1 recombinase family protein [Clostridium sp. DJ247]